MKVGVTVDEVKGTRYTIGKYDFYTRQMELDPEVAKVLAAAEDLFAISQRILSSMYNSNGKYIIPEDLENLKCAVAELAPQTPAVVSVKQRKPRGLGAPSNSESLMDFPVRD